MTLCALLVLGLLAVSTAQTEQADCDNDASSLLQTFAVEAERPLQGLSLLQTLAIEQLHPTLPEQTASLQDAFAEQRRIIERQEAEIADLKSLVQEGPEQRNTNLAGARSPANQTFAQWAMIAIGVVVIAAIGAGAYFYMKGKKEEKEKKKVDEASAPVVENTEHDGKDESPQQPAFDAPPSVTKSKMPIGNSTVEVIAEHGIDIAKATGAKHFTDWVSTVAENQDIKISQIHFQTWDAPRSGPQLEDFPFESMKFKAKATKYEKEIPGIVFMRGSITSLLVILKHEETSHVLMMRRPRAPVAVSSMPELIEGCIDADGNFIGDGAKELKLKAGIEINESDNSLIKLTAEVYGKTFPGMYPSCGGCDEFNRLLVYRKVMDDAKIDDLKKNLAGQAEGDLLKLELIPLKDLWRKSPDAKALSALCLHDKLIASSERKH